MLAMKQSPLKEILGVGQDRPHSARRWFHNDYFDLFVTQDAEGQLTGFELCYGGHASERALVWEERTGYFHDGVESGEGPLLGAGLTPGGDVSADPIVARLESAAAELPETIRMGLQTRLREYASQGGAAEARRKRYRRQPAAAETR